MQQSVALRQTLSARMIPEQIVASALLRMTASELRDHVAEELENNPALDVDDMTPGDAAAALAFAYFWDGPASRRDGPLTGNEGDYLLEIPAQESLRDYLWEQFVAMSAPQHHPIGRYLIESIDDNGYLSATLLDLAAELDVDLEQVEQALHLIQGLDPPGVGARDLRECLDLQLRDGCWNGEPDAAIALDIVARGWDLLVSQDFAGMAQHLGREAEEVQRGYAFIRRRLAPYPGQAVRRPWQVSEGEAAVLPDVCVRRAGAGYLVDVTDGSIRASSLRINREYQNVWRAMNRGSGGYSEEERAHVLEALARARLLLNGLARRTRTLQRVTECIIGEQRAFIEGDPLGLRPLTRREVARRIALSESTVSRATNGKYVQLPSGAVCPFEAFFDVAAAIKRRLTALLASEDPCAPLKDQEIAERLKGEGIDIARRTVTKYREEIGVPNHAERRRNVLSRSRAKAVAA